MIISKLIIKALSVNSKTYANNQLIPKLIEAMQSLFETRVQCREMLQLVDNIKVHMSTADQKDEHVRQQEFWASNLDYVAKHLTVMEKSVKQIEQEKLSTRKSVRKMLLIIIDQAEEFAERIDKIYEQIILSITPIEAKVRREIALELN